MEGARLDNEETYVWNIKNTDARMRLEAKESYRNHLRMCEVHISYSLTAVKPLIMKYDVTREALPDVNLQISLQYLAKKIHIQLYNTCVICPRQLPPDIFLHCWLLFQRH
jgi:hypothetical protein